VSSFLAIVRKVARACVPQWFVLGAQASIDFQAILTSKVLPSGGAELKEPKQFDVDELNI
jgi:hypothetical protein